jgi:hypothetical protein
VPEDCKHIWIVRLRPGGQPVPILYPEVAEVFRDAGWQVTELPGMALSEDDPAMQHLCRVMKRVL